MSLSPFIILCRQHLNKNPFHSCAALTAYNALFGGVNPVKAGDYVVVLGTGGVSMQVLSPSFGVTLVKHASEQICASIRGRVRCGGYRYLFFRRKAAYRGQIGG